MVVGVCLRKLYVSEEVDNVRSFQSISSDSLKKDKTSKTTRDPTLVQTNKRFPDTRNFKIQLTIASSLKLLNT